MGEFELIRRYFQRPQDAGAQGQALLLGIGDDAALLQPRPGFALAVSCDMLVSGRHFLPEVAPEALGHKALAVNLSDLAAMGARPLGFTLSLALPAAEPGWLAGFAQGLFALADAHACPLIGGDTTRGPLNLCLSVFGEVPPDQALRRSGGRPGDDLYVSGRLGEARLALAQLRQEAWVGPMSAEDFADLRPRLERPSPRVALGLGLRGLASAALDLSDGLAGDLGHLLRASGVGADLALEALPTHPAVWRLAPALRWDCLLNGGDDYELLFSAPPARAEAVMQAARASATAVTCIGRLSAEPGLRCWWQGQPVAPAMAGFDHFAGAASDPATPATPAAERPTAWPGPAGSA